MISSDGTKLEFPEYPVYTIFSAGNTSEAFYLPKHRDYLPTVPPHSKSYPKDDISICIYKPLARTNDSSDSTGAFTATGFNCRVSILARTADSFSETWKGWTGFWRAIILPRGASSLSAERGSG